jgi:outer membrane immunogenic protein
VGSLIKGEHAMKRGILGGLLGTAAALLVASGAQAADKLVAPARVSTWTGFYGGVNAGYGFGEIKDELFLGGVSVGSIAVDFSGVFGGGQIGFNAQQGGFVWGVEADIQASGQKGRSTFVFAGPNTLTVDFKVPWFATVRGRAAIANGPSMFFVTGGAAYANGEATATLNGVSASASESRWGWTVGAGYEGMLAGQWSWKIEYLFLSIPDKDFNLGGGATVTESAHDHLVRIGLNYRFGG